ncbi:FAD-binding protein [Alteromonas sp. A079]|uniref:FAD-binding protein n=1 Tax=Alteromonas sp. A079 TaxID=3410268 RepID=UPI003BA33451
MHDFEALKTRSLTTLLIEKGFAPAQILTSDEYCTQTTYNPNYPISTIVKPMPVESTNDSERYVQLTTLISTAKEYGFSIHPVSKGLNLGYGGFEAYSNSVIVDLSNFTRINNFDEKTGQITVEPGVTQEAISQFLKDKGNVFIHDTTGAPKQASVVGNYLERGFGHTPLAEHAKNILHAQVIVPLAKHQQPALFITSMDGVLTTQNKIKTYNIGPDSTGLVIQNNIGVVTSLTIKLLRTPSQFVAYFIPFNKSIAGEMIDVCAQLRAQGTIHSAAHIGNNIKSLQLLAVEYPGLIDSYNLNDLEKAMNSLHLDDWTLSGGFYGTRAQVSAHKKDLKKAMRTLSLTPIFIGPKMQKTLRTLERYLAKYKNKITRAIHSKHQFIRKIAAKLLMVPGLNALCDIKQGTPSNYFLKSIYWRNLQKRTIGNLSPEVDNVGLLWGAPCSSIESTAFSAITQLMENKCQKYGLECPISVTLLNDRTMESVLSLSFDRGNEAEVNNAMNCYEEIMLCAAEIGFVQYRMSTFANSFLEYKHLFIDKPLLNHKALLDPCNVISPSKYSLMSDNFTTK